MKATPIAEFLARKAGEAAVRRAPWRRTRSPRARPSRQ